ncbi:uncharacterized protein LOC116339082 [Contarinia nasturtii]|uniref:uncharacterized protein LOC116339082 n=1 Tax=Contarinia nasturtii TaxID=265458 RepID=UPI0012D44B84|nr:uncharacterized protein LOC116339082 [Contarinia nasturtii]
MNGISKIILIVLFTTCVNSFISRYHTYPYYPPAKRQIYGNVEDAERIGFQRERRWGFPFFTREALIIFPSEYTTDSPYDYNYFIKGIVHENLLDDDDCLPKLEIIEGGIFDRNTTMKITSLSGCGIHSEVSIYGHKSWRN